MMFRLTGDNYTLLVADHLPLIHDTYRKHAILHNILVRDEELELAKHSTESAAHPSAPLCQAGLPTGDKHVTRDA